MAGHCRRYPGKTGLTEARRYYGDIVKILLLDGIPRHQRPGYSTVRSYPVIINDEIIPWQDENGVDKPVSYAYDPRLVKIDDWYYVTWCDDMHGASIGLGRTKDFKTWYRLPNPLMPFNRNGVLFPRRINGMKVRI